MKKLYSTNYSLYTQLDLNKNTCYSLKRFKLSSFIKNRSIYTLNIIFSFKKKSNIQITGFCKSFYKPFSKGSSFHVVYNFGKTFIVQIFPFFSPKFLNFSLNN